MPEEMGHEVRRESYVEHGARPALSRLAESGALAMAALGIPLFVWSAFNASFLGGVANQSFIIPLAVFFGAPAGLITAMWAYTRRDMFLATAAGVIGGFWLSYGLLLWLSQTGTLGVNVASTHQTGFLFIAWAITFAALWVGSVREHWSLSLVSLGAAVLFAMLAVGYYRLPDGGITAIASTGNNWIKAAGWIGFVTAGLAWYTALAELLNAEFERPLLPTSMESVPGMRPQPHAR